MSDVFTANLEEGASSCGEQVLAKVRRPVCLMAVVVFGAVALFAGGGPLAVAAREMYPKRSRPHQRSYVRDLTAHRSGLLPASPTTTISATRAGYGGTTAPRAAPPSHATQVEAATRLTQKQPTAVTPPACGDGVCEPPETVASCFADCPGVTTLAQCGEEPHSDPQGTAVVDG